MISFLLICDQGVKSQKFFFVTLPTMFFFCSRRSTSWMRCCSWPNTGPPFCRSTASTTRPGSGSTRPGSRDSQKEGEHSREGSTTAASCVGWVVHSFVLVVQPLCLSVACVVAGWRFALRARIDMTTRPPSQYCRPAVSVSPRCVFMGIWIIYTCPRFHPK